MRVPGGTPPAWVWGIRGRALSHPRLPALWPGCQGPLPTGCGCGGVRAWGPVTNPTARALPSWLCALWGRHEGARGWGASSPGVGRPVSGALPPPTARPLGGLPGPTTHWLPVRGGCGRGDPSPTPQRALFRAGFARCGGGTRAPGGGAPPAWVWGVRGGALSHPRRPALWAGCRGPLPTGCGCGGVRAWGPVTNPTARALASWLCALWGRHEGARGGASCLGVGRPGSGALPAPTARPLGGLPGPTTHWLWVRGGAGVGTRHQPHSARSFELTLRAVGSARGRSGVGHLLPGCGASGVGRSPTPDCPPFGRAAGAHYLLAVGAGGCGRGDPSPTPQRALLRAGLARCWGGMRVPGGAPLAWVWGVRGRALPHPRLPVLWAGCQGPPPNGCGCGGVRAWGPVTNPTARALSSWLCALWGRHEGARGGAPPAWVWGVRGRALSHPRLPALWAGCRGPLPTGCGCGGVRAWGPVTNPTARALSSWLCALWGRHEGARGGRLQPWCGASGVGRSPNPDGPPSGRAAGLLCVCVPCLAGSGGPASRARFGAPHLSFGLSCFALCLFGPLRAGVALFVVVVRFFFFFFLGAFPLLPLAAPPLCPALRVIRPRVPWALASAPPPPFFFFVFWSSVPSVRPVVFCFACFPAGGAPAFFFFGFFFFFFSCPAAFFPALRLLCVFWGVVLCVPYLARSLCCARRLCCFWWLVLLVPGVAAFRWGSAGGSGCPALSFGGVRRLWCPCLVWPSLGVLPVVSRSPVLCPVALCCRVVLCCGALSSSSSFFFFFFFFFSSLLVALVSCCSPLVLGSGPVPGRFCFCPAPVRCCAGVPAPLLSVPCSLALVGLAGVLCCCLFCLCVCCWAWLSSVVSWWVLVAPGVMSRRRAVVCSWVLCCAVLLRVVLPGVALLCAVLFRFAPFGAAARCVVSLGAVLRLGVLCLLAPFFVLSPRAVCVLLWCVAAWCCSPLCFVPCAPWGAVLCVSCRLRPVRCCCVARSPLAPCFPVLCSVVLCCRVVPRCPVLPPCWVCFLRGCSCTYLNNRC